MKDNAVLYVSICEGLARFMGERRPDEPKESKENKHIALEGHTKQCVFTVMVGVNWPFRGKLAKRDLFECSVFFSCQAAPCTKQHEKHRFCMLPLHVSKPLRRHPSRWDLYAAVHQ